MLKLTYTENHFSLEHLTQPLEDWVTVRTILSLKTGTALWVEPSTASFLLPADLPHLPELEAVLPGDDGDFLELTVCDEDYVEVTIQGTWITSNPDHEEGVLVAKMSDRTEFFLTKLWQDAQSLASVVQD